LFLLFFVQDIAHDDGGYSSRPSNVLTTFSLAGFQVTTIGRIWVTAEGKLPANGYRSSQSLLDLPPLQRPLCERPPARGHRQEDPAV
jgi:hypothetical protein